MDIVHQIMQTEIGCLLNVSIHQLHKSSFEKWLQCPFHIDTQKCILRMHFDDHHVVIIEQFVENVEDDNINIVSSTWSSLFHLTHTANVTSDEPRTSATRPFGLKLGDAFAR